MDCWLCKFVSCLFLGPAQGNVLSVMFVLKICDSNKVDGDPTFVGNIV